MTTISIAMATCNGARFLRQQLDSFARQTLLPCELVVCDDGSTDATLSILEEFAHTAPFPVVIVKNPVRLGYTANFFQAAQRCKGHLIAFSDQDDEWLLHKLAHLAQASRSSSALLLAHADELIDENGASRGIIYPTDPPYRQLLRYHDYPGHAITVRKQFVDMTARSLSPEKYKQIAGNVEFGHDVLYMEMANAMETVLFLPEVLVRWRIYTPTNFAWVNLQMPATELPPASAEKSLAERIFPSGLAQRYQQGESDYRRHATLLAAMLRDLQAMGEEMRVASGYLAEWMGVMAKRADVMALRARMYATASRRERIRWMLQGAAMGQYRHPLNGGVGYRHALRDLLACCAPNHWIRRAVAKE